MENLYEEHYNYEEEKKNIIELLKDSQNFNPEQNEDIGIISQHLDYLIQASKDLGIPFIYLIIGKISNSDKNLGEFLISLYFNEIEIEKLKELFFIILNAFNYIGPKEYNNSNSIEGVFIKNMKNLELLKNNDLSPPRIDITQIENIYFKIVSTIDCYNSYIEINEESEERIRDIKEKYEDCKKEIENFKKEKMNNLQYNLDFFNDLFGSIDLNKLDKKKNKEDEDDINKLENYGDELNNINVNINDAQYNLSLSLSKSFSEHFEKILLKDRRYFILNERINQGEDIEIEFKNYFFFNNENKEVIPEKFIKTIQKLICGFLNNRGGRIYFGIDDNKYVKGNYLSYKQRDELRLKLINLTTDFYPECKSSKISVHYIPIKDSNQKFLNDRYVTKMIIKQGDTDKLYSVSYKKYKSFKRLQGMVELLKSEVIAEEIYKRRNNPEKPIPEKEFIDPEPEENFYENKLKFFDENNENNHNYYDNEYDNDYDYDNDYYNNYNNDYNDYDNNNYNNDYDNDYNNDYNNNYNNGYKNQQRGRMNKRRRKKNNENLISIKVKNISEETPVFLLKEQFKEDNDIIENLIFFEHNQLSSGFGYICVRDFESANKIIKKYNNIIVYGKKIKLYIQKKNY